MKMLEKIVQRDGADFLEIVDVDQFLLDGNGDSALDIFRCAGFGIEGGDLDEILAGVGEEVALQLCARCVLAG